MSSQLRAFIIFSFLALVLTITPAYSTSITTYTSRTGWALSASGIQTIDFEGLAPANGATNYNTASGLTVGGVEFIGIASGANWLEVVDTNFSPWYNFGSNDALAINLYQAYSGAPVQYFHIILSTPVTAFGVDLATISPNALTFSISVGGGTYSAPTFARPTLGFFGFTSDTPFTTIDISVPNTTPSGGTYALLDNFSFGTAQTAPADTPEIATFVLIGSGLVVLGGRRKWLSRRGRDLCPAT